MIQIPIENMHTFIEHLLSDPFFGDMEMVRLELTTFISRTVDGRIHKEFFDTEEDRGEYIRWETERENFMQAIQGKIRPLSFRIIFRFPPEKCEDVFGKGGVLTSFFLNVNYDRKSAGLTTGISQNFFPADLTIGKEWDGFVQNVAQKMDIS